ncbi:hypothetical protein PPL_03383 [Heterostelium album PN500]|uniref:B box-type domain-containing protein n=1 Tax=Heterostelium pallidum (strain ATCC 26659 / Pp 5 / PN500) TaxID=670386 RepID=D3B4Q8_HETP5|nr:hypothetical protein PPL_03383 [Heterostelium album PN500]EFA84306.1 hypothetical protein PPL_03383 [Heterostelium album PN500]|eukprot:XP_020436421.1 hypothetical protein PPL_03383 [Heterostelium album PN500]
MTIKCFNHQRSLEFICYQCNSLFCSKCISSHNREHPDHSNHWEHIDDIKDSLNTLKLDDIIDSAYSTTTTTTTNNHVNNINNDSTNNESSYNNDNTKLISQIKNKLKSIWESLRSSTSRYQSLTTTENDIKQHFEVLHQYLITEEHKLQRDIINDKGIITNQIDSNINHLKYLINIIMIFNKLNNSNSNSNINRNSTCSDNQSMLPDTTSLYSTATIIESVISSTSLQSFINDNNQTLFNEHLDIFNMDELLKQHSDDSSSLLLDIIHKYNNQFSKSTTITDNNDNSLSSYKLSINKPDFNQLNSIIKQSINLAKKTSSNYNRNEQSYIFVTHKSTKGATLINTSNNYSIEELQFDYDFWGTFSSIVSIGEYVYIFGGSYCTRKWIKISIQSKSVEYDFIEDIIRGDSNISVCYDGQDHIYLVNGWNIDNRIDRFNIKTKKFESYHQLPEGYLTQVSSMIFKGSLYSVSFNQNKIFQFDLTSRTISDHQIDNILPSSACHDNNGNFFILDTTHKRFIQYNVETKQTNDLNSIPHLEGTLSFVMYHRESPTSSYIYSFGSSNDCNFKYSIESNQCEPFLRDIKNHNREWCASTSITF